MLVCLDRGPRSTQPARLYADWAYLILFGFVTVFDECFLTDVKVICKLQFQEKNTQVLW